MKVRSTIFLMKFIFLLILVLLAFRLVFFFAEKSEKQLTDLSHFTQQSQLCKKKRFSVLSNFLKP